MKLPSLRPAIDTALADGNAVVVQLVSTAEAMLNRRIADLSDAEREALEIDLSPREYVVDYLTKSFPVRLMSVFTDENGNARSEPMSDEKGTPVLCRSALAARDRMIEQLRSEEHTSELQSLMRISYAVFCLKKKKKPEINSNIYLKKKRQTKLTNKTTKSKQYHINIHA